MKIIEANNLSFGYGGKTLFSGVEFCINKGEFVKLTGPNGSGKSTLVKLIIKELEPAAGQIKLLGEDIKTFRGFNKIGYMPQKNGDIIPATVLETVLTAYCGENKLIPFYTKKHKEGALAALRRVKMEDYVRAGLSSLSGGQYQRVMAARLLAARRELLILDEPMAGIDAETVGELYALFKSLTEEGVTVLMISHDTTKRDGIFDRTLCLAYGNLMEVDREQVMREMHSLHTHPIE